MIIQNGFIREISTTGGGVDPVTGHPTKGAEKLSRKRIPCQWSASRLDLRGKSTGEPIIRAQYSILIEQYDSIKTERLCLEKMDGSEVGRFSVISIEPLDAVNQTRIIV